MTDLHAIRFHFKTNTEDLEAQTERILLDGKKTQSWYLVDFYSTFRSLCPLIATNINSFQIVVKEHGDYVVTESGTNESTIISLKKDYNEEEIKRIIKNDMCDKESNYSDVAYIEDYYNKTKDYNNNIKGYNNRNDSNNRTEYKNRENFRKDTNYRETNNAQNEYRKSYQVHKSFVPVNKKEEIKEIKIKPVSPYDDFSDEDSQIITVLPVNKRNQGKRKSVCYENVKRRGHINSNFNDRRSQEPNINYNSKNHMKKDAIPQKFYIQDSDQNYKNNTIQQPREYKNEPNSLKTYSDYKRYILEALEGSTVFLLTTFNGTIIRKYNVGFVHKNAIANRFKGVRSKLSAYLDDCNDFLERLIIGANCYYKRIDVQGQFLIEKRKNAHLEALKENNEKSKYHLEMLLINMFPIKTTTDLADIEVLFENVYGLPLREILRDIELKNLLFKINSPNMILKEVRNNIKVTLVPTADDDYKEYNELSKEVYLIEMNILNKIYGNKEIEIHEEENIILNYEIPFKITSFIKTKNKELIDLLNKTDHNLPRSLLKKEEKANSDLVYDFCAKEDNLIIWSYLHEHLNLNEHETYYDL